MGCSSINAALRACMPCPAAPATRRWVLADRVTEDRAQPGQQVTVRLDSVPARDSMGRIAHVRGIYVSAGLRFTVTGINPAVSAYQLRGLFDAVFLQDVTGHAYWPSINARDILDDNFFRHFARVMIPYLHTGAQGGGLTPFYAGITNDLGIGAALTPGQFTRRCDWYAPLTTLGPGQNPLAGLIPLAAVQRRSNAGAFRFRLLPNIPGNPANIVVDGFSNGQGNPGLDVWLDVVYLPALAVGPTWTLDSYTLPDQSGVLRHPEDTTEHVHIRYYPEDVPSQNPGALTGQASVGNLNVFSLSVAGFLEMNGDAFPDAITRMMLHYGSERDSAHVRANAAQDLPIIDSTNGDILTMTLLAYRPRGAGAAKGAVTFKFGDMGGNAFVRYNHRTVSCNEVDRAQTLADTVGCDPCSPSVMTDAQGKPTQHGDTSGVLLVADPSANRLASA